MSIALRDDSDSITSGYSIADVEKMATLVAGSELFAGIKTKQAAFALMMICQAEGLHPMAALRRFHIINGKPSMRADAMQAEFQRHGGVVEWEYRDRGGAAARFIHPIHAPAPGERIEFTEADAKEAGVFSANPNYKKWPRAMYSARVISEGVRAILPGIVVGIYTPEEVQDFDQPRSRTIDIEMEQPATIATAEVTPPKPTGMTYREYLDKASNGNTNDFDEIARELYARMLASGAIDPAKGDTLNTAACIDAVDAKFKPGWIKRCDQIVAELYEDAVATPADVHANDAN